jgi:hypothetical protein
MWLADTYGKLLLKFQWMMLNLLSAGVWSWREESNLQPAVYKTAALPIELRQLPHDIKELHFYRLSALGSSVPGVFSWRYFPSLLAACVRSSSLI